MIVLFRPSAALIHYLGHHCAQATHAVGGMMTAPALADKARLYLQRLCRDIPTRRIGSHGNRLATDFFAETVATFGFQTTRPPFNCLDWTSDGARLSVNGIAFPASVSPYSLGCHVRGPLLAVATIDELEAVEARSSVLLACGELTKEPLMPKRFPFYNPDEHQRIIRALESKQPLAIIAATPRNPELAGALYPFPWIEDGDLDIPSVYMTDEEGMRLATYVGTEATLDIHAQRIPATGCNVLARKGTETTSRLVVCAHIDAKEGTPGALDNASGTVILLLLAELLAEYRGNLGIELVALNGEDHFANPGEQQYLQMNAGKFDEIVLCINLDGVGYCHGNTAYSLYDCPPELTGVIQPIFSAQPTMIEGERWYQGDHSLFLMQQRPALALTSERSNELLSTIVHTPQDEPELVDSTKLVASAYALRDLVVQLNQAKSTRQ
jgi:aminopeptidase YwaD